MTKPLSWSSLWLYNYSKEEWYAKYVLHQAKEPCLEDKMRMEFGFRIGKKIQEDPTFLPVIPRYEGGINEYKFECENNGIPLIGYSDHFSELLLKGREDKTGEKWTNDKAQKHGQLIMYSLMSYLILGKIPEWKLVWMPSARMGDGEFNFTGAPLEIYGVTHTLKDLEKFSKKIDKAWKEMDILRDMHQNGINPFANK